MKLFGNTSSDDIQKLTDKSKNKNVTVADWDSMDRVTRMSMSTVSFLAQVDSGILWL